MLRKKGFLAGLLVLALALGMFLSSCESFGDNMDSFVDGYNRGRGWSD
jgi:hypothetical protein